MECQHGTTTAWKVGICGARQLVPRHRPVPLLDDEANAKAERQRQPRRNVHTTRAFVGLCARVAWARSCVKALATCAMTGSR